MQNFTPDFFFQFSFLDETISFKEVSGLQAEMLVETIKEEGENQFKGRLPTIGKYSNIVLKRGLVSKNSAFVKWCADTLGSSIEKPVQLLPLTLSLLNPNGEIVKRWVFYKVYPIKCEVSDCRFVENSIVVETLELGYTSFKVVQ